MKVSKTAKKGARALFLAVHTEGRLDQAKVRSLLAMVTERRPAGGAEILHEFHRLVRLELESHSALVESAEKLTAVEVAAIEKSFIDGDKRMTRIEYLLYVLIAAVLLGPGFAGELVKKILGL